MGDFGFLVLVDVGFGVLLVVRSFRACVGMFLEGGSVLVAVAPNETGLC
jgi:hypothetical protein